MLNLRVMFCLQKKMHCIAHRKWLSIFVQTKAIIWLQTYVKYQRKQKIMALTFFVTETLLSAQDDDAENVTSERSASTKLKLNESTKRNACLSLRHTSPWRATNCEECDVVWCNQYFSFIALLASLLLMPWCILIEQGDTTRPAVGYSEPSEDVKK